MGLLFLGIPYHGHTITRLYAFDDFTFVLIDHAVVSICIRGEEAARMSLPAQSPVVYLQAFGELLVCIQENSSLSTYSIADFSICFIQNYNVSYIL
jgi:hypothetical protein